jgi:hypothetical protein
MRLERFISFVYFRIVAVSPEAKSCGISRSIRLHDAKKCCSSLVVIPKTQRFNKPESRMIREAHYKFRKAIVDFTKDHLPYTRNRDININIEISGCDEFFLDLTPLVDELVDMQAYPNFDTNRTIIVECKKLMS